MFKRILIANRSEIAVRIIAACKELAITSVAVYSEADKNSLHVRLADEAYLIGPPQASESYLNKEKIIQLSKEKQIDAIHPGYGFLSENAEFISMVEKSGITFIGPSSHSVFLMGEKTSARKLMQQNNVPIVPGTVAPIENADVGLNIAKEIGFPVMLKAAAGGGGKGMRKIFNESEFESNFQRAQNESLKAFGKSEIYIEKLVLNPKHIEVQIIGDKFGNYFHLFERECSVQRRHQKVVEEAPSISVDNETRNKITSAAILAAKACNYVNAGTVEFLMDKNKNFYFLEMNTRLQVEHPVTEMITGIDLVKLQIKIASGEKLDLKQESFRINGHALECRIYAEDVENNFAPSVGKINHHQLASGPGVRIDRGIEANTEVQIYYDPILAKLVTWGKDRTESIERMKRALKEYQISGVITNIPIFQWILNNKKFLDGSFNINFLDEDFIPLLPDKWKDELDKDYSEIAAVISALLKESDQTAKKSKNEISNRNQWLNQNYE
jgi:acetyl-CoA carboxylase biotin carboxylase subunit